MKWPLRGGLGALALGAALCLSACGDTSADLLGKVHKPIEVGPTSKVIGGPCTSGASCASGSDCHLGENFPDGLCSIACAAPAECPGGSTCIALDGGICLLTCASEGSCRHEYKCKDAPMAGSAGTTVNVCWHD